MKIYENRSLLKCLLKSVETEVISTKTEMNNFNNFSGRCNHFICIQEEFPHLQNGC